MVSFGPISYLKEASHNLFLQTQLSLKSLGSNDILLLVLSALKAFRKIVLPPLYLTL